MTMQMDELLTNKTKASLMRLASQNEKLELKVAETARPVCNPKKPINHDNCEPATDEVRIDSMDYIFVGQSDVHGMCVRIAFDGDLYVAKGYQASIIVDWGKTVSGIPLSAEKIPPFPEVLFCKVAGKVRIDKGELVMA